MFRKVRNEVQTLIGYPMQPTTDSFFHTADIDGKSWPMKSIPDDPATPIKDNEAAWLASMDDEAGFVTALKNGHQAGRPRHLGQGHQDHRHLFARRRHRGDGRHRQGLPVTRNVGRRLAR